MLYLDASAVVPLIVRETSSTAIATLTRAHAGELLLSNFAATEVVSALSRLLLTRHLDSGGVALALEEFDDWSARAAFRIEVNTADLTLADAYVRRFELKLRAPDAIHLAVAVRLGAALVTLDKRLAGAARVLGVLVEQPA